MKYITIFPSNRRPKLANMVILNINMQKLNDYERQNVYSENELAMKLKIMNILKNHQIDHKDIKNLTSEPFSKYVRNFATVTKYTEKSILNQISKLEEEIERRPIHILHNHGHHGIMTVFFPNNTHDTSPSHRKSSSKNRSTSPSRRKSSSNNRSTSRSRRKSLIKNPRKRVTWASPSKLVEERTYTVDDKKLNP